MKVIFPRFETDRFHQVYDGGNKYIDFISQFLVQKGIEVEVVTTIPEGFNEKEKIVKGVKYVFLNPINHKKRFIPFSMFYKMIFSYHLGKYLKNKDFDILHNTEMFAFFYTFQKKKKPIVTQGWGLEPFYGPESSSQRGIKKLYVKLFLQKPWMRCLRKSEMVASEGEFQNELVERLGIPKEKIFVLSMGLDLEKILEYKKNRVNRRKENGISSGVHLVLNVNQISTDKAIEDIIDSFSIIKKSVPDSKLIVIGAGKLEKDMHEWIKNKNLEKEVIHKKNLSEKELYDYFFSSDIFISASIQKDWIMSIQEAMACGLPIVSSNQPFLVHDGLNGYVVGSHNPEGMAEKVVKIIKEGELRPMGKESEKLSKKYSWSNIADIAIKEYGKLISLNKISL